MIIVEKNPGQKIDYEVNKTKLTFDDDLTLNLAKREEDYAVHIDVCFDEDGALCIGAAAGRSYVAQIDIPPRQYKEVPATAAETTTGEAADDADGSHTPQQTTAREPLPLELLMLAEPPTWTEKPLPVMASTVAPVGRRTGWSRRARPP